jgi:hypothetical protein
MLSNCTIQRRSTRTGVPIASKLQLQITLLHPQRPVLFGTPVRLRSVTSLLDYGLSIDASKRLKSCAQVDRPVARFLREVLPIRQQIRGAQRLLEL